MSLWRPDSRACPSADSSAFFGFAVSVAAHLVLFAVIWLSGLLAGLFEPKETVVPIDLTVIVNENLDGVDNEPPPLLNPPPPPPPKPKTPPKAKPKKQQPPKALEQIVTNIVTNVDKKNETKSDEKKKDEKKDPPKKDPPKPTKTAAELKAERLQRMRENAVKNKKPVKIEVPSATKSGNGRTQHQPLSQAEIAKLLGAGVRPGTANQLAESDLQFGVSRIQMSLDDKWERLAPKVGRNGTVLLTCRLNSAGGLVNVRLAKSCGDPLSDQAALTVARSLQAISGLPETFRARFMKEDITIRYQVSGR